MPTTISAYNALIDTTTMENNVSQSMTNVILGIVQVEDVLLAIMDMTFNLMELVNFQLKIVHHLTLDAVLGIGRTKNVFNAQTTGFSTVTESVSLSLTNVIPLTQEETAFLAMSDITFKTENAF